MGFGNWLSNIGGGTKNFFSDLFSGGGQQSAAQPQPQSTFAAPSSGGFANYQAPGAYQSLSGDGANALSGFNEGSVPNFGSSVNNYATQSQPGGVFGKALDNASTSGRSFLDSQIPSMYGNAPDISSYLNNFITGTNNDANKVYPSATPGTYGGGDGFAQMGNSLFGGMGDDQSSRSPMTSAAYSTVSRPFDEMYSPDAAMSPQSAAPASSPSVATSAPLEAFMGKIGQSLKDVLFQDDEGKGGVWNAAKDQIPGGLISLAGQQFGPKAGASDFGGVYENLMSQMQGGGQQNPATTAAIQQLLSSVQGDPSAPPDSAFTSGDMANDEQLIKDLKQFDSSWKAIRPNADVTSDAEYQKQRQEIIDRSARRRGADRDQLSFQYNTQQQQERYNSAMQLLNLDKSQMDQYIRLAQLPIATIMQQTGIDSQKAQEFQDLFGALGKSVTQDLKGLNPQKGE